MQKYKQNPRDTLDKNFFTGCLNEEFVMLPGSLGAPFFANQVGITHPDKDYFISRKVFAAITLEYVVSGEGFVEVDGKHEPVTQGDIYLLLPGKSHSYGASKTNPYEKIWINFVSDIFLNAITAFSLNNQTVYHAGENFKPLFYKLLEISQNETVDDNVQNELSKVVYSILADLNTVKNSMLPGDAFTRRVYEVLSRNTYGKPKIKELASTLCVSEAHLIKQFKQAYGVTPYHFLLDKKIETAKTLLSYTDKNVRQVAQELGFDNEHYFSDIFKQKTGYTPTAYRRTYGKSTPPR